VGELEVSKRVEHDAIVELREREEEVLRADVAVAEATCIFLGEHDDAASVVAESLEHGVSLAAGRGGA